MHLYRLDCVITRTIRIDVLARQEAKSPCDILVPGSVWGGHGGVPHVPNVSTVLGGGMQLDAQPQPEAPFQPEQRARPLCLHSSKPEA